MTLQHCTVDCNLFTGPYSDAIAHYDCIKRYFHFAHGRQLAGSPGSQIEQGADCTGCMFACTQLQYLTQQNEDRDH